MGAEVTRLDVQMKGDNVKRSKSMDGACRDECE